MTNSAGDDRKKTGTPSASDETRAEVHDGGTQSVPIRSPGVPLRSPSRSGGREAPLTFEPGDQVADRYRVVRFVAAGAMGEVYEVEDLVLHASVALKTIRPEIAEDEKAVERFKREILVSRRVTHPNVCRVFDVGVHHKPGVGEAPPQDVLFLTMELLAGETLSHRLAHGGTLSPEEALPLVAQMAAGLDAAHAAGIIHRDFKSGNVILVPASDSSKTTRAVITDFGLARHHSREGGLASISDAGTVLGTPAYMAPEQVQGLPLTPAADLYALGIVVYEMVTGVRPFDGGSAISVAARRLTEPPPPPRTHVPTLDPAWEKAILRCLERAPQDRFGSASDLVRVLASDATAAAPARPRAAGRPASRRWLLPAGATLIALLLLAGYLGLRSRAPAAGPTRPPTSVAPQVTARRAVAVVGLSNASGQADAAWLGVAVSEMLVTELATGGKLRVLPGQDVARARMELGLGDPESLSKEALARLRASLGADLLVGGSYTVLGAAPARLVRIDVRLRDAGSGEVLTSSQASGSEGQLFELVSRAGAALRDKLGVGEVSPAQALAVRAALPAGPDAARLYAEGLARLRRLDARGAIDLLEKAALADAKHPMPQAALADAWASLGYDLKAQAAARRAVELVTDQSPEDRQLIEARSAEVSKDWVRAVALYRDLFTAYPDDVDRGLKLAVAQNQAGDARAALATIEVLHRLPPPASQDPRIDLTEARVYQELGDFARLRAAAARAAQRAPGARILVAEARILEATACAKTGDHTRAMAAAEEARDLFDAAGHRGGVARALEQMANALYDRGNLDQAQRLFERALTTHRELGDTRSSARVLLNLATLALDQGRLAEAAGMYDQSLAGFRQVGARYEAATALLNMGARLFGRGDLDGAQKKYGEALAEFQSIGEKNLTATALTNLGEVLSVRGQLDEARKTLEEALALHREIGAKSESAYDLFLLGDLLLARGDAMVAGDRYREALAIQEGLGERVGAAQTRLGLAVALSEQGKAPEAEAAARQAEEVARNEKAATLEAQAQAVLARCLLAAGRPAEAREVADRAKALGEKTEDRRVRILTALTAARAAVAVAPTQAAAALASLQATAADAKKAGFLDLELETRLAGAEAEKAAGRPSAKASLEAVRKLAEAKGYGLIARKAATLSR